MKKVSTRALRAQGLEVRGAADRRDLYRSDGGQLLAYCHVSRRRCECAGKLGVNAQLIERDGTSSAEYALARAWVRQEMAKAF